METTKRIYKKHKTEEKITIRYDVNTKLNPSVIEGIKKYPIYIRINVKGNNTYIKSRITTYSAPNELEEVLNSKLEFVRQEKKIIKSTILSLNPSTNENFSLKEWDKLYKKGIIPAHQHLEFTFFDGLVDILLKSSKSQSESAYFYEILIRSHLPNVLSKFCSFLSSLGIEETKKYIEDRKKIIYNYANNLTYDNSLNSPYEFCLFDIDSGFFQEYMSKNYLNLFGESEMKILNKMQNKILDNYYD